jgi:hypothetical protein
VRCEEPCCKNVIPHYTLPAFKPLQAHEIRPSQSPVERDDRPAGPSDILEHGQNGSRSPREDRFS